MENQEWFNKVSARGPSSLLRKTQSIIGLKNNKTLNLPKITSPRQGLEMFKSRKCSLDTMGVRLSVIDPLPSINKKSKRREHFRESPIFTIKEDNENLCQDFPSFLYEIQGNKVS